MRKSALIAVLCLGLLTGCGKDEPVVSDPDTVTTTDIEEQTTDTAAVVIAVPTTAPVTTAATAETTEKTTVKTTAAATTASAERTAAIVTRRTNTVHTQSTSPRTTTSATQTTASTTTSPVEVHPDPAVFTKDNLSCKVTKDGIDVIIDNEEVQKIEIDTEELLDFIENKVPGKKGQIVIDDVDLDGHSDLFIPQQIAILNTFGVYYHYDSEEKKFVPWEELEEIDSCAEIDEDEKTFKTDVKLSEDEYEIKIFGWDGSKPVLRSMTKQYRIPDEPDDLFIDTFDYTSGEEVRVKHERVLFDSEGNIAGTEELELS